VEMIQDILRRMRNLYKKVLCLINELGTSNYGQLPLLNV
jgi:hypothetical protein